MPLTGLHTDWIHGSYANDRDYEIKISENATLAGGDLTLLNAHVDTVANHIAVGYGYDLFENLNTLQTDLAGFVTTTSDLNMVYNLVNDYMNNGNPNNYRLSELATAINNYFDLGTEAKAAELLAKIVNGFEAQLDIRLGYVMDQSRERAALISMAYNGGIGLIGDKLCAAITNDNRAEAWYQIRYKSNGGASRSQGIANRRYREAELLSKSV